MKLSQQDAGKQYFVDTDTDLVKTEMLGGSSELRLRVEQLEQANFRLHMSYLHLLEKVQALEENISVKENNSPSSQNNAPYSGSNDAQLDWSKKNYG